MLGRFHDWYVTNQDAITWFLIGLLFGQGVDEFIKGNYMQSAIILLIAALNFGTRKIRVR